MEKSEDIDPPENGIKTIFFYRILMIHKRGYYLSKMDHYYDKALCNEITKIFDVKTAVDIGCGDGRYVRNLNGHGIKCVGFDGYPETIKIPACGVCDFSKPVDVGKFDLVLCLEVGEHIPRKYEQIFLDNVVRAAFDWIVLSWAIPGQGGNGHVNCRDNWYIAKEMRRRDYEFYAEITKKLRESSTISWFRNTLMVYKYDCYREWENRSP
jgi:SAM-dependent methyltransferase